MDARQQRIADDLAGSFAGDLRFDRVSRSLYATDASLYEIAPLGVACPRHVDDVQVLARYADETGLPLIPRGAGTGLAGAAVGAGLIVDFARYMTRILEVGEETVTVEPGVVLDTLNRRLRPTGRYFAPDPSNSAVTTIGGMLGVDAAGSHAVRVGSTRDHVVSIEAVHAGGDCLEWGREPVLSRSLPGAPSPHLDERKRSCVDRLARLLATHRDLIQSRQPSLIRNCAGYHLRGLLIEDHIHVPRLLVGSEGTLALFTRATLHTIPIPPHRGVCLLLFSRLDAALDSVQRLIEQQPSACDLLDRRLLSLGREADERFARIIPQSAEAALIVEQTAFTEPQARQRMRLAIDAARSADATLLVAGEGYDEEAIEFLWSLPRRVVPNLTRLVGETRPQPFVEDIAVPPAALRDLLRRAQQVLQKHKVIASLYAHAASGQVHFRPFLPLPVHGDGPRMESLARELYEVALSVGGTISGEHGDGLSRTSFLRTQYGPLYRVFREVKEIFDPRNLLNPGKVLSDDPHLTIQNFRRVPSASGAVEASASSAVAPVDPREASVETPLVPGEGVPTDVVALQLVWSRQQLSEDALRCNGCGVCRTTDPGLRMCPLFRAAPREEATPRAKANATRSYLSGLLPPADFAGDEMKRVAELCFNCKQCQLECPSHVDVPHLVIEAKAHYVAANGMRRSDWILSRAHSFGALGRAFAPVSNWLLNSKSARWLLEKLIGIDRRRKLPRFAVRSFLASTARSHSRRSGPLAPGTVIYFVDHFVNHHDPHLGWAFVRLLEHFGIPVHIPAEQTASGMAMISAGDLEGARALALQNVRTLAPFAREGHPIVCTEPAAALALRQEYPWLIDHPDLESVVNQVQEAGQFLVSRNVTADPRFQPQPVALKAAYHTPCHTRALVNISPWLTLLEAIPQLEMLPLSLGCSGMAGTFGLVRGSFDVSLEIGRPLMERLAQPDLQIGLSECSSCKLQMEQGTTTPTLHPLKLLALACGLLPEARLKLTPNSKPLLVS